MAQDQDNKRHVESKEHVQAVEYNTEKDQQDQDGYEGQSGNKRSKSLAGTMHAAALMMSVGVPTGAEIIKRKRGRPPKNPQSQPPAQHSVYDQVTSTLPSGNLMAKMGKQSISPRAPSPQQQYQQQSYRAHSPINSQVQSQQSQYPVRPVSTQSSNQEEDQYDEELDPTMSYVPTNPHILLIL